MCENIFHFTIFTADIFNICKELSQWIFKVYFSKKTGCYVYVQLILCVDNLNKEASIKHLYKAENCRLQNDNKKAFGGFVNLAPFLNAEI